MRLFLTIAAALTATSATAESNTPISKAATAQIDIARPALVLSAEAFVLPATHGMGLKPLLEAAKITTMTGLIKINSSAAGRAPRIETKNIATNRAPNEIPFPDVLESVAAPTAGSAALVDDKWKMTEEFYGADFYKAHQ
ncbi:MAG: hypothetical protein AAGA09_04070 [Pseudomonadota bacterium]